MLVQRGQSFVCDYSPWFSRSRRRACSLCARASLWHHPDSRRTTGRPSKSSDSARSCPSQSTARSCLWSGKSWPRSHASRPPASAHWRGRACACIFASWSWPQLCRHCSRPDSWGRHTRSTCTPEICLRTHWNLFKTNNLTLSWTNTRLQFRTPL